MRAGTNTFVAAAALALGFALVSLGFVPSIRRYMRMKRM
jgi:hypothetical protein